MRHHPRIYTANDLQRKERYFPQWYNTWRVTYAPINTFTHVSVNNSNEIYSDIDVRMRTHIHSSLKVVFEAGQEGLMSGKYYQKYFIYIKSHKICTIDIF